MPIFTNTLAPAQLLEHVDDPLYAIWIFMPEFAQKYCLTKNISNDNEKVTKTVSKNTTWAAKSDLLSNSFAKMVVVTVVDVDIPTS